MCECDFYKVFYNFYTWRIFYALFGMKKKERKITKTKKTNFCSKLRPMQHLLRVTYKTDFQTCILFEVFGYN